MKYKLTISLLLYKSERYLPDCLNSLFNQTFKDWRLVVLDNNSPDNSFQIAKELCAGKQDIKFLKSSKNLGFVGGNNVIMKQVDSQYIMLLNPDTILDPDYIEKIINFLDKNEQVGAGIGKILQWDFDNKSKLTNKGKTDKIDTAGLKIKRSFEVRELGAGELKHEKFNKTEEIFGVSGCLPIYRNSALKDVGYFDQKFFNYKEDVDLAFRLQNKNWQAYRIGEAVAYHERKASGSKSLNDISVALNRKNQSNIVKHLSYRNHLYILIKNLSASDLLRYGIFISFYEFKKIVFSILFEQKNLLAWTEVFKNLKYLINYRKNNKPKSIRKWIK